VTLSAALGGDLKVRAAVGVGLIVLAVAGISLGGMVFSLFAGACGLLMLSEWAGMHHISRRWTVLGLLVVALPIILLPAYITVPELRLFHAWALLAGSGALLAAAARRPMLLAGILYAGLPTVALVWLRSQPWGVEWILWTLIIVWATDIFAYFAGRAIGGRRLSPRISPNKTWAGLVGGIVAASLIGGLVAMQFGLPDWCAAVGGGLALLAQAGDLFESWLKRRAGVKDSGRLLPGHGGAMDRLDGAVPVAVVVALAVAVTGAMA
jgi:phosphatidate cytidylyltransferase